MKATEKGIKLTKHQQYNELITEVLELKQALFFKDDRENLAEELMDVIQWCVNIGHSQGFDMILEKNKHKEKLRKRGHRFVL